MQRNALRSQAAQAKKDLERSIREFELRGITLADAKSRLKKRKLLHEQLLENFHKQAPDISQIEPRDDTVSVRSVSLLVEPGSFERQFVISIPEDWKVSVLLEYLRDDQPIANSSDFVSSNPVQVRLKPGLNQLRLLTTPQKRIRNAVYG